MLIEERFRRRETAIKDFCSSLLGELRDIRSELQAVHATLDEIASNDDDARYDDELLDEDEEEAPNPTEPPDQAWRADPMTDDQRRTLEKLKVPVAATWTRGEASDAITHAVEVLWARSDDE